MSSEKPTSSRETFDKNEDSIALKKQEIAKALESGDWVSVATLAQEAKGMETAKSEMMNSAEDEALETNKQIDEAKAAEEKAQRVAAIAEAARLDAENSAKEAAALLEKLKNGGVAPVAEKVETAADKQEVPVEAEKLEAERVAKGLGEMKEPNLKNKTESAIAENTNEKSSEITREIERLGNIIGYAGYEVRTEREELERIEGFVTFNKGALDKLKNDLGRLVRKSNISSVVGGYKWELVKETEEYRKLSSQESQRRKELYDNQKRFDQVQGDETIRNLLHEKRKYDGYDGGELKIASVYKDSPLGEETVYVEGVAGAIDTEGIMTLGDAINKSTEYWQNNIEKSKKIIEEKSNEINRLREQKIDLENKKSINDAKRSL